MRLYYRISDKSYDKVKLPGASKEVCFRSAMAAFGGVDSVDIIADNCEPETIAWLSGHGRVHETSLGNAGSFRYALDLALGQDDGEIVYFAEDDYLYLPDAVRYVEEGMRHADFVTLYDHPDKYTKRYGGGESSRVFRTVSSHWRYTVSTCMTFAARVELLRVDRAIWSEYLSGDHPHDHQLFCDLGGRGRRLAVCIPGRACHTDLTFSGEVDHVMMEPWAIEKMISECDDELDGMEKGDFQFFLLRHSFKEMKLKGWDKLRMQAALINSKKSVKNPD